eukprot:gene1418-1841_t
MQPSRKWSLPGFPLDDKCLNRLCCAKATVGDQLCSAGRLLRSVARWGMALGDDLKRRAAAAALAEVQPGMKLGLGTGSTAREFVDLLGERVRAGLTVLCVPTSEVTASQAR